VVFVEIDVKEIKDAVSERLIEIGSYFKEKLERGEKYTVDTLLSRIASVAEDIVKRYVKRATGEDASCKRYFWTHPGRGVARLLVTCSVPGIKRMIDVSIDTGFIAELNEKLGNVTYLLPATLWNVDVEVFYEER
jgi:uncharacterized Zn finger protein